MTGSVIASCIVSIVVNGKTRKLDMVQTYSHTCTFMLHTHLPVVYTYIHTYIQRHTYIHTYIQRHTYIHTYIHTLLVSTYIHY